MFSKLRDEKKRKYKDINGKYFIYKSGIHRHIVVDIIKNGLLQERAIFSGGK